VANLIDSGWAAWLPFELVAALEARDGKSAERRAFRKRLEHGPSDEDRERWERFALVCPSRIDLPAEDDLDEQEAYRVLDDLGLLAAEPESVELVLTLDHDDVRELERIRAARDVGPIGAVPAAARRGETTPAHADRARSSSAATAGDRQRGGGSGCFGRLHRQAHAHRVGRLVLPHLDQRVVEGPGRVQDVQAAEAHTLLAQLHLAVGQHGGLDGRPLPALG
jgi:hypothetical protein